MSTYWGYRCEACNEDTDMRYNHGDDMLADAARLIPQIRALETATKEAWLEVTLTGDYSGLLNFARDHYDHGLVLVNEYGDVKPIEALSEPARERGEGDGAS